MKTKTLHRHLHPIHWHGSMYVAIAAILVSVLKTSSEMLRNLQQTPAQTNLLNSVYLREAENQHTPIILTTARHASIASK